MSLIMKAMKFTEPRRSEIVDVPKPMPEKGEVLVKVKATGICASDIMAFKGEHPWRIPPVITGHEISGTIVELGSEVKDLELGERVAIEPHIGCGMCIFCRHGHYHVCPNKRFIGVGEWIGGFSEYVVAAEAMCYLLPEGMTHEEGAALEPFCVGLHAVLRAHITLGETVAILGCGTIGMMTLISAKIGGPGKIIVSDISSFKRELALRSGADLAIDPTHQDPVKEVLTATEGLGVDVVFIAVPLEIALRQGLQMCRRMGRVILIATFHGESAFDTKGIQVYERSLIGTSMYTREDYQLALELWKRGSVDLRPLITRRIALEEAPQMISSMADGTRGDEIKTVICFD